MGDRKHVIPVEHATPKQESLRLRQRILVVEDEPVTMEYLIKVLRKAGYDSVPAVRATDALRVLTSEAIDLLITDIKMPGMDGFDMLRRLRQLPHFAQLPVIVCSALKTREYVAAAAHLHVHSFVGKPIDRAYLLTCIATALQGNGAPSCPPSP